MPQEMVPSSTHLVATALTSPTTLTELTLTASAAALANSHLETMELMEPETVLKEETAPTVPTVLEMEPSQVTTLKVDPTHHAPTKLASVKTSPKELETTEPPHCNAIAALVLTTVFLMLH
jgi:hypothetical protein